MTGEDDARKTAGLARDAIRVRPTTRLIGDYALARRILRSDKVRQAGAGSRSMDLARPEDTSLFYLDGEPHRRRRAAVARYFTLRAIDTRYQPIMARAAEALVAELAAAGGGSLDDVAFRYAVAVAAEVIGLDHVDLVGLSRRIEAMVSNGDADRPTADYDGEAVGRFNRMDVDPAIAARRDDRREDVISRLLDDGASDALIRTEVRGYAMAGMMTTREFVAMAAWHLLQRADLGRRFVDGDCDAQLSILEEIVRLEPPVGVVKRRVVEELSVAGEPAMPAGTTVVIDLRGTNADPAAIGGCPFALDPDRTTAAPRGSGYLSFGDGAHRCPGAQLAMHEARTFLDALLRLPGLALASEPRLGWFAPISTYEVRDARVSCAR